MRKLVLASLSGLALLSVAACSDSGTDNTQTQSVDPATEQPMQQDPAANPGTDATGTMQQEPAPTEPAPAQ